jgi:hypothetical protein
MPGYLWTTGGAVADGRIGPKGLMIVEEDDAVGVALEDGEVVGEPLAWGVGVGSAAVSLLFFGRKANAETKITKIATMAKKPLAFRLYAQFFRFKEALLLLRSTEETKECKWELRWKFLVFSNFRSPRQSFIDAALEPVGQAQIYKYRR